MLEDIPQPLAAPVISQGTFVLRRRGGQNHHTPIRPTRTTFLRRHPPREVVGNSRLGRHGHSPFAVAPRADARVAVLCGLAVDRRHVHQAPDPAQTGAGLAPHSADLSRRNLSASVLRTRSANVNSWSIAAFVDPGRHHFDVIEALADPSSALTDRLLD